jgi:hypothetical protein
VILEPIRIPYLRPVGELQPFEVNVGSLSESHLNMVVGVRWQGMSIAGRMCQLPTPSLTRPLLIVRLGDRGQLPLALHPADAVLIVPEGHRAAIVISPRDVPGGDW